MTSVVSTQANTNTPVADTPILDTPKTRRILRADFAIIATFLLASAYVSGQLWLDMGSAIPATHLGDPQFFEFMFAHAAHSLLELDNPFFTDRLNVPNGVNLMANTSVLGLGIPLTPITLMFGPHTSYVVAATLSLAGTAIAWYYVLSRHLVTSRMAATLGAALAGFGPGIVAHSTVHLNFASQFVLPFIIWRALKLADSSATWSKSVRNGVILGALLCYQFFIGAEVLLFTALACGVFLIAYLFSGTDPRQLVRDVAKPFGIGFGTAVGFSLLLLAYPMWYQFFGPQNYRGLPMILGDDFNAWGADAGSYAIFASESLGAKFQPVQAAYSLSKNGAEQATFLGIPLLAVLVVGAVWLWRNRFARAVAITGAVFVVLSLGPRLLVLEHQTQIPLPWALFRKLPLLDHVIPVRFGLVVLACAAVLLAMIIDKAITQHSRWWLVLPIAAIIPLIPTPLPVMDRQPTPELIASGQWRDHVREDRNLLIVPLPSMVTEAMRWSGETGLQMRLTHGYFLGPGGEDGRPTFGAPQRKTAMLIDGVAWTGAVPPITAKDRQTAVKDVAYWRVDAVALAPTKYEEALRQLLTDLFGPGQREGGMWVWDVQSLAG